MLYLVIGIQYNIHCVSLLNLLIYLFICHLSLSLCLSACLWWGTDSLVKILQHLGFKRFFCLDGGLGPTPPPPIPLLVRRAHRNELCSLHMCDFALCISLKMYVYMPHLHMYTCICIKIHTVNSHSWLWAQCTAAWGAGSSHSACANSRCPRCPAGLQCPPGGPAGGAAQRPFCGHRPDENKQLSRPKIRSHPAN